MLGHCSVTSCLSQNNGQANCPVKFQLYPSRKPGQSNNYSTCIIMQFLHNTCIFKVAEYNFFMRSEEKADSACHHALNC